MNNYINEDVVNALQQHKRGKTIIKVKEFKTKQKLTTLLGIEFKYLTFPHKRRGIIKIGVHHVSRISTIQSLF